MRHPILRWTLALAVAVLVTFTGTVAALAATVAVTGVAHVEIDDGASGSVSVPVPAIAADAALAIAHVAMPAEERDRLRREVAPYQPLLAALASEIERCPDATLVEVVSHSESVRVEKRGRDLVVDVEDHAGDTHVQVTVPARTLTRLANFLAS